MQKSEEKHKSQVHALHKLDLKLKRAMDFTPSLGSVDREKIRIQARPTGSYKERHPLTTVYSISILQTIAESCCDKYSLWPA